MKRALIFLALGVGAFALTSFAKKKKESFEHIIEKLEFQLKSIKNFDVSLQRLRLDLDVIAVNPTKEDLYVNTGVVKAKVIRVYQKKNDKLLGISNLDTNEINIPGGGFYALPTAAVEIPLLTGGQMVLNHLLGNKDITKDFVKELRFELDIEALGNKKTIKF
ncbi:conserved protein of unknown function [Tenacibaculum sp. 190524A02b]|uniref:hypothetical protein n=1 Tax=Tenacibaculum vairaonense TaxID=3137860 RepID=UPI0032B24659